MRGFEGLRIALVGPLPPPSGGMANQTHQLAELLRAAGSQVELVRTNAPYQPAWAGRIPVLRAGCRLLPYLWRLWRAGGRNQVFHVMANSGWSWHLFAAPAIRIAAWRGVPVLVNYRGGEAASFLHQAEASVRRTMTHAAVLAVPSGYLQSVFAGHGMAADIVANVVDLERFRPAPCPRARRAHLVVTRNLEAIYDNATAIRALALLRQHVPHAQLTIAGSGPERAALQALAHELGLTEAVSFSGRLERDAMAALYRDADIVLNPSLVDNTPNSLLEAMASGVPIVSTDVGGVPYIVQDGTTALLVPPRDPGAMAAAARRLLENPAIADRLVEAGLAEVRQYTWQEVSHVLASAYQRARERRDHLPAV